jgi:HAD superfamily hydrolase (TIGR01549 family)
MVYTLPSGLEVSLAPLKAVCFDMGDTLAYQHPAGHRVLRRLLHQRGISVSDAEVHRARLAANSRYYALALARPSLGIAQEKDSLVDEFDQTLLTSLGLAEWPGLTVADVQTAFRSVARRFVLFPDVRPTLRALSARGLRLAVVSNWDHDLVDRCRELGLVDHFDAIVGSATVRCEKPDPSIFDRALDRLGVSHGEAWHVGDLYLADVLGARAAGITPILLDRYDVLPELDCRRIRSLGELVRLVQAELAETALAA